jgi:phage/plasmid-like protein (TIGR03299 family)
MSKETLAWLNTNVLIGFTDKRGRPAWHYRASEQGDEPNHYPLAIPVADVQRRLFHWQAVEAETFYTFSGGDLSLIVPDGGMTQVKRSERKTIIRSDTGAELGSFKAGYRPHQYGEWLVKNVATILDDELSISAAGLLKGGAVAWVEVSVPDTITTPDGVTFRPNLLAATSFDGSIATTYKRTVTNTVCDNTMAVAMSERGQTLKIRHSLNSMTRIADVREALAIVHTASEDFMAQVAALCDIKFSEELFEQLVDKIAPLPKPGEGKTTRPITLAETKRNELYRLWSQDERCKPWRETAFGALQTLNTYQHHSMNTRGKMSRPERNLLHTVNGTTEKADTENLELILTLAA